MSKVILFSRVSTLGQDLTQQNDELYAEAKRNGYEDIVLIEQKESAIKLDEDEQKQRIIRECIKSVYVDIDGVTNRGKIIEINMIDGIKHTIHMTKKGNDFITNIVLKDKEKPLNDLQITARFIRKKKS